MLETLKNAWKVVELRKKILYTVGMLLIYRLLCFIPVPGVDTSMIQSALDSFGLLGFINTMTGSNLSQYTIMAMGIIKKIEDGVKIMGNGDITKKLTVKANKFTASAKEKIEAAGGKAEVI